MPTPFAITVAANQVRLGSERRGEAVFTVFNATGRTIRGRATLVALNPQAQPWLTLVGDAERDFAAAEAQQYAVQCGVPPSAPAGSYSVRLNMVGVEDPDEYFAEGPTITFEVPVVEATPRPFPWWIVAAVVALVVVLGGAALLLRPGTVAVPDVAGQSIGQANAALTAAGLQVADEVVQVGSDTVGAGQVAGTEPPAGTAVQEGTEITLQISTSPQVEAFRMVVEDAFAIVGRGVAVTGVIESGSVRVRDAVLVTGRGRSIPAQVLGVEGGTRAGDRVALVLGGLRQGDVQAGDVIEQAQ